VPVARPHSIRCIEGCTFPRNARGPAPTRPPFLRNFRAAGILGSHGGTQELRRPGQQDPAHIRSAPNAHPPGVDSHERPTRLARCRRRAHALRASRSSGDATAHVRRWRLCRGGPGHGPGRRPRSLGAPAGRQRQARRVAGASRVRNTSSGASRQARTARASQAGVVANELGGLLARTRTGCADCPMGRAGPGRRRGGQ
jgi:hypothetical protein